MAHVRDALKECFEKIRLARAADMARGGRYQEAETLLAPNGRISLVPRELDLLARIAAQKQDYQRAGRLWETALQCAPGNTTYQRAAICAQEAELNRAEATKAAPALAVESKVVLAAVESRGSRRPLVVAALLLLGVCAWLFFAPPFSKSTAPTAATAPVPKQTPEPVAVAPEPDPLPRVVETAATNEPTPTATPTAAAIATPTATPEAIPEVASPSPTATPSRRSGFTRPEAISTVAPPRPTPERFGQ
jgi:hypothetical protein